MSLFTVVIAEKEHISSIQEYGVFLKPFLNAEKVVFCPWDTRAETLTEALPSLVELVARRTQWRAIVLTDDRTLHKKNPFDVVDYIPPRKPEGRPTAEYLEEVRKGKFAAYDQAARQPLTRLMTHLCEMPMTSAGKNNYAGDDPEFNLYLEEAAYKQKLREQIIGDEKLVVARPTEILCLARRTYSDLDYEVNSSWTPHTDLQYSRFYDWNLYFDRMRYMVFDILPEDHQNYPFDYVRFLYALLLLAQHEMPAGSMRPNTVYRLDCENDEGALRRLLVSYDEKLLATDELLRGEMNELRNKKRPQLTDQEVASVFCAGVTVPVTLDRDFDKSGLFAKHREVGLSSDCPRDEETTWDATYLGAQKTLHQLLKKPRRALKKATDDMRRMDRVESDRIQLMNAFQMEDVEEFIDNAEMNMIKLKTSDLYDNERYKKQMEDGKRTVDAKIETRMSKKATIILGVVAAVLCLIGCLPLLFGNMRDAETATTSLLMILGIIVLLLAAGLVCLFALRYSMVKCLRGFNDIMAGICAEIEGSMDLFSRYLSYVCNLMRGYSVTNYYRENEDPLVHELRVREKHRADIQRCRVELKENFSPYLLDRSYVDPRLAEPFQYNYSHAVDFSYPMPYNMGEERQIEFIQKGSSISVPVDFVRSLTIRLEELYD